MSRTLSWLIDELVSNGLSLFRAHELAMKYYLFLRWRPCKDESGYEIPFGIVVAHAAPLLIDGQEWQGGPGSLDGRIICPVFKDGEFIVGEEKFTLQEIHPSWHEGSSLFFYRSGFGWITLDMIYHLPPGLNILDRKLL